MKLIPSLCLLGGCLTNLSAEEPKTIPQPPIQLGTDGTIRIGSTFGGAVTGPHGSMLGVSTSTPPAVLLEQLGLKQGLVIDYVVGDSSAAKAGLQAHDILLQVNDQLLFHPDQLSGLLQYLGAGKEVKLAYLHQGKRNDTSCTLREADVPAGVAHVEATLTGMAQALKEAGLPQNFTEGKSIDMSQAFTTVMTADGSKLTIRKTDGTRHAEIKDAKGTVIFEGPVDTEEQRKVVPDTYRRYLKLADGGMLEFGLKAKEK